eukprot:m.356865 g.356865  ORF g.356865 m.356865 type:complete len:120 (+) comp16607_c0_seq19:470-829(+)
MQHSPVFTLYTEQDVSAREIQLKFTRKRGSTTAEQADLPINRAKRHIFWTMPHPLIPNGSESMEPLAERSLTLTSAGSGSRSTIAQWEKRPAESEFARPVRWFEAIREQFVPTRVADQP